MSTYPGQEGLRTPLKVARGLGSSRTGVRPWWLQRVTAVALVPLSIWFLFLLGGMLHDGSYPNVLSTIAQPVHAIFLIVFAVCLFWHGALGLQVVIEDYVHTRWLEVTLQIALRFGALLGALACVMAVLAVWLSGPAYY
ncbi:MAG TPA: succinate dehydrogenase, hydrophobic membrane anchor protein [Rhodanobacteraceae bacterium]|jgi:succinate dehydrogenase / fumarate reductase membrane anchor subunit|nr:succinate dehydrogenase, hydrophobic membrane anchor protein [Rhodanobacteraceae bacterium]